jgi:hypothetical protein
MLPPSSAAAVKSPSAAPPSAARASRAWTASLDLAPDGVLAKLLGGLPFAFVWTCARRVSRRWAQLGAADELWRAAYAVRWRAEHSSDWAAPAGWALPVGPHAWARAYWAEFEEAFEPLPDMPKGSPPVLVKMLMATPSRRCCPVCVTAR